MSRTFFFFDLSEYVRKPKKNKKMPTCPLNAHSFVFCRCGIGGVVHVGDTSYYPKSKIFRLGNAAFMLDYPFGRHVFEVFSRSFANKAIHFSYGHSNTVARMMVYCNENDMHSTCIFFVDYIVSGRLIVSNIRIVQRCVRRHLEWKRVKMELYCAAAMAFHSRLGCSSPLSVLTGDLLAVCFKGE